MGNLYSPTSLNFIGRMILRRNNFKIILPKNYSACLIAARQRWGAKLLKKALNCFALNGFAFY
jgi:hypothetical protein